MRWHLISEAVTGVVHYREDPRKERNLAEIVFAAIIKLRDHG
jgi:hypothetical protein